MCWKLVEIFQLSSSRIRCWCFRNVCLFLKGQGHQSISSLLKGTIIRKLYTSTGAFQGHHGARRQSPSCLREVSGPLFVFYRDCCLFFLLLGIDKTCSSNSACLVIETKFTVESHPADQGRSCQKRLNPFAITL